MVLLRPSGYTVKVVNLEVTHHAAPHTLNPNMTCFVFFF